MQARGWPFLIVCSRPSELLQGKRRVDTTMTETFSNMGTESSPLVSENHTTRWHPAACLSSR